MPLISVIVPVYKVEPYLARCVDSILNQTYADFELILVDDGSPDRCGHICDEYARTNQRVHVIHQKNGGLSAARNAGIDWTFANSDSQWLTFIDSDDWVHPCFLEYLYNAACKNGTKASCCLYTRVSPSGEEIDHIKREEECERLSYEDYFSHTGVGFTPYTAWAKLYRKETFSSIRYPFGKLNEDLFTTHRVLYNCGNIARVNQAMYYYFQSPQSIMRNEWNPKRLDEVEASEKLIAFMRRKKCLNAEKTALKRYLWVLETQKKQIEDKNDDGLKKFEQRIKNKIRLLLLFHRKTILPYDAIGKYNEKYFPKLTRLKRKVFRMLRRIKR